MVSDRLPSGMTLAVLMQGIGSAAAHAATILARASRQAKDTALLHAASQVRQYESTLLAANARDMEAARRSGLANSLLDRLELTPARIAAMADGLEAIAVLPDPIGRITEDWQRPNGLRIQRVRVPLGVIGIIYESRPNVTADAGGLCLKSGNAAVLRCGSESLESCTAIYACLREGLRFAGLPPEAISLVPTTDRDAVGYMLSRMSDYLDVLVPRGGRGLIERVKAEARVPVIGHLDGNCHVYVDREADLDMAREIVLNAKLRRTGVCGAAETLLVDSASSTTHLGPLVMALLDAGCEVRGDAATCVVDPRVLPATEQDWYMEYLDSVIAVCVVDGVGGAIEHIARYGSAHTDSIVTNDALRAEQFLQQVDSAIVLHNASTQFADGGEFGFGAEIGISTDKFHARGPVGVEQLTSYKYVVRGNGQVRPG